MARLLVTGGAGFIGSHFIRWQQKNHPEDELLCLDKLTYAGSLEALEEPRAKGLTFVRGDICDRTLVLGLLEEFRPQYVVNFAAESHVDRSIAEPGVFVRANVEGVQVLLDGCRTAGVERFHQVSTDEVYGQLPLDRYDLRFAEEDPIRPSSPYSAAKAAGDLLVLAASRTYGQPVTISRGSNTYGSWQHPEKLIPRMILLALEDRPLPVYGQGINVRDWLYVEDHCAAIDAILRRGRSGQVYNVGASCEKTNLEVVGAILKALNKADSLITFVADRPGHDLRYALDWSKMGKELGWAPAMDFNRGLEETVRWYLSHRSWATWQAER